jgi:hypothetical protein
MKRPMFNRWLLIPCFIMGTSWALVAQRKAEKTLITDPKIIQRAWQFANPLFSENDFEFSNGDSGAAGLHFKKIIKSLDGEKWFSFSDGYVVEFTHDCIPMLAAYNKKGNWEFTVSYNSEKDLPVEVRQVVKNSFPDFNITRAEKVRVAEKTIYVLHMQNEKSWKNVRVCEGEMEAMEDFNKP